MQGRTINELRRLQSLSLNQKIDHAVETIEKFCNEVENPVISFSGGKDSTVLMHLVRNIMRTDLPAVFINTGNEYPEIVRFVREFDNVQIIRPKMKLKKNIERYGFPLISKEYSKMVFELRHGAKRSGRYLTGIQLSDGKKTSFILPEKYRFLVNEKFSCSEKCCNFLKKTPTAKLNSITGMMAEESIIRQSAWLRTGCNSFGKRHSKSKPFSVWTNRDIQSYISRFNVRICDLYKDPRIHRTGCMFCGFGAHLETFSRYELLKERYPKLYDYFLNLENNEVTYKEALKRCGVILPGERGYQTNFFGKQDF
ncbi:MAG: phosphoadenosine phosphosulfate reductase family protein [Tannerellaceae bacterium]|jgi:3'-phosphoadenosine 5'-phosphosulfate sulfotransferase (PAPS reductase)/FAD synthetase|nr:phosphoadenosine phosphosulfate reductase family protein [Tannerellaceae bacterium]